MRAKIKQKLIEELGKHEQVLGCFEGGSAAFGRADEWSDLDFQVIVKDDFVEQAVEILENALAQIAPIEDKFILPAPTWHGQWQGFYKLEGISPYLLIDALIIKESSPTYFSEPELHGKAIIAFDKTVRIGNEHININDQDAPILRRIQRAENLCHMMHLLVDKEIKRNRIMDAFELYYNLYLRTLVELLRIKYDKARWSFGPRYLSHDLPEPEYNTIKDLSYVSCPSDLLHKKDRVLAKIEQLLQELKLTSALSTAFKTETKG